MNSHKVERSYDILIREPRLHQHQHQHEFGLRHPRIWDDDSAERCHLKAAENSFQVEPS